MWSCGDGQQCPGSICCFSSQLLGLFNVFQEKHYVLLILWCTEFAIAPLHVHQAGCNSGGTGKSLY